jgi:DNA polymerase-3 subunit chi
LSEVRFYQLRRTGLERALPQILDKLLGMGERVVVMAGSPERAEALNVQLWTYDDRSFLPHGSARDGFADQQPVYLTASLENPNGAGVLVLVDGAAVEIGPQWRQVIEFFDGNDEAAVAAARERWKAAKAGGHQVTYWLQNEQGKWEKKAG